MEFAIKNDFFKNFSTEVEESVPTWITLLGDHSYTNHGFIMPMAINKQTFSMLKKNGFDHLCRVYNENRNEYFEFYLNSIFRAEHQWQNDFLKVVRKIQFRRNNLKGFDCIIKTELEIGEILDDSSAFDLSITKGLNKLYNLSFTEYEIIKISQNPEYRYTNYGFEIMDKLPLVLNKKDHLFVLDCKTLEVNHVSVDFNAYEFLLLNTDVTNNLNNNNFFDVREKECEAVVKVLQQKYIRISTLRDITFGILEEFKNELPESNFKRIQYILAENLRVKKGAKALKNGNVKLFGGLMYLSHEGLQNDYEVSNKELDFLVNFSKCKEYVYGAKMMSGKFPGCVINLIKKEKVAEYVKEVLPAYQMEFNSKLIPSRLSPWKAS